MNNFVLQKKRTCQEYWKEKKIKKKILKISEKFSKIFPIFFSKSRICEEFTKLRPETESRICEDHEL